MPFGLSGGSSNKKGGGMSALSEIAERRIRQLHHIYPQMPIKAGFFPVTFKAFWTIGLFSLVGIVGFISAVGSAWQWGGLFTFVTLLFWYFWIIRTPYENKRTTRMAMSYRQNKRRRDRLAERTLHINPPETREIFGSYDPDVLPPPKIDMIGPLHFNHVLLDDQGHDMGVLIDELYDTASASLGLKVASILTAADKRVDERLRIFARTIASLAAPDSTAQWFKWRDTTFKGEEVDPENALATMRKNSNLHVVSTPLDGRFAEGMRAGASESWEHRTTVTAVSHLLRIRKQIKQRGSVEQIVLDNMEAINDSITAGAEEGHGHLSRMGVRKTGALTHRDTIMDIRVSIDPVFAQKPWQMGAAKKGGIYMDALDAYPGFACFDEDEHPEWGGCIKVGLTFWYGFEVTHPTQVGLTSEEWAKVLLEPVRRTIVAIFEPMPLREGRNRARWGTASRTMDDPNPADRAAYESAAQVEQDIVNRLGMACPLRLHIGAYGATPEEALAGAKRLDTIAKSNSIMLEPLSGRQEKLINALLPSARDLRLPNIPLWMKLWGYRE
jgi:hypothetical protein